MDIVLGNMRLNDRQISRFGEIVKGNVKGVAARGRGGDLYQIEANVTNDITPAEINNILEAIAALSSEPLPHEIELNEFNQNNFFKNKSVSELDLEIDQMNELEQIKSFLKKSLRIQYQLLKATRIIKK